MLMEINTNKMHFMTHTPNRTHKHILMPSTRKTQTKALVSRDREAITEVDLKAMALKTSLELDLTINKQLMISTTSDHLHHTRHNYNNKIEVYTNRGDKTIKILQHTPSREMKGRWDRGHMVKVSVCNRKLPARHLDHIITIKRSSD